MKPKYELNQTCYIITQAKIKQFTPQAVRIISTYRGHFPKAKEWGDTDEGRGGYPWRVHYSESPSPKGSEWVSEELIFATKEELIESISK